MSDAAHPWNRPEASSARPARSGMILTALDGLASRCVAMTVAAVVVASLFRPPLSTTSWWLSIPITLAFFVKTFQFHLGLAVASAALLPALRRRPIRAIGTFMAALAIAGPELAHAWPAPPAAVPLGADSIRVFSLNLLGGNRRTDDILAAIRAEKPNVILFQEYTHAHHGVLPAGLAASHPYRLTYPAHGAQGLAIYADRPFAEEVAPLPGTLHARLMAVRFTDEGAAVPTRLVNVHPTSPGPPGRVMANRRQMAWLLDFLKAHPAPTIIAGDCNFPFAAQQADELRRAGLRHSDDTAGFGLRWTWSPRRIGPAVTRIDHVFATGHFIASSSRVLSPVGSDHRPVVADLARTK